MSRKVIIDVDTGLDDAVALLLAIRSPELDVQGITCVNGNCSLDNVIRNTLRVVDQSGMDIPVYAGATAALFSEKSSDATHVHGRDGLGGIPFPEPKRRVEDEHAVDFIVRTLMSAEEPMDWITLGPLTNAALAYMKEPRIAEKVRMLTMMAGGVDAGNATPTAEFNVYADPEAARIIFSSEIKKTMVPLDPLFAGGFLTPANIQAIKDSDHLPWCDMASQIFGRNVQLNKELKRKPANGEGTISPPDLCTVAINIDPSIAHLETYYTAIETNGDLTRGMTVVDRRKFWRSEGVPEHKMVKVALSVDQQAYAKVLLDTWLHSD